MNATSFPAIKSVITSASLREEENVSGISSVVSDALALFKDGRDVNFKHLRAAARDKDGNLKRIFNSVESVINLQRLLPGTDIVHINTDMTPKSIIRDSYFVTHCYRKRPIILHVHGGKYLDRRPNSLLSFLVRRMVRLSNRVILLSERERQIFTSVYGIEAQDHISVLPNFVAPLDEDALSCSLASRSTNERLRIVFVGRLEHTKGLGTIVDAFAKVPEVRGIIEMDVYGTGSQRDWFCCRMTELLGRNFQYQGVVSRSEVRQRLSQYHLILLPSLFGEGLPMALLEGMAAGCVPLASALASVPTVVQPEVTGILLRPGSADDLADKLTWAVRSREQLIQISHNAAKHIQSNYNPKDFRRSLLAIYRRETAVSPKEVFGVKTQEDVHVPPASPA
jgi:glycosyltransferase involved in cell wall biosynthesis